ncbi:DNA polymerase III subunit delta [Pseudoalteromonas denitrificans]|uniref:DNA polymerase III subunit delta n=1 Tax=Pseudoalteromonas denitrificans DSM 6059 TaxID=1123010 RepID=A0A1I1I4G8_9GAMM|nr:DNA polymerase III subunit delta [Pseudoalteromonas denitrificans]SFC29098.1 DNA polymerase III, delta subunit [Pseudoalteromonas denitrificans DSM 6059]
MRCYVNQLPAQLNKNLNPFYLVMGEEPFQVQKCTNDIRKQAKKNGFDEVIKFSILPQFDWNEIAQEYNSLSLFSDKRIIEIDLAEQKTGQTGAKFLKSLAEHINPDCIVIIKGNKAGQDIQRTAWFKALDKQGLFIPCYEITDNHLNTWLNQQCQNLSLKLDHQAKQFLLESTQGNLLATHQELEKLVLLYANKPITKADLTSVLLNQSKFDIFDLSDALLQGNLDNIVNIISNIKKNHGEVTSVSWAITRDAQQLLDMSQALQLGENTNQLFKKHNIWKNKQALYQNALNRIPLAQLKHIIILLAQFDISYKSGLLVSPWQALAHIGVCFTQTFSVSLPIYNED